jgi:coenzyme F420 hydrogenase subunit beta
LTQDLDTEVRRMFEWKPPIGAFQTIASARAVQGSTAARGISPKAGADERVITALMLYMLENYLVQGAVVSTGAAAFSRQPQIARTREQLVSAKAASADPAYCEALSRYDTCVPILSTIKALEREELSCVAVVGTPCQIGAVRKVQCLGIVPAQVVGYTVGRFCAGHFSFDMRTRRRLEEKLHIDLFDIDRLHMGREPCLLLRDGRAIRLSFDEATDMIRPACLACTGFANDYADIAVGRLGSPEGYATLLIRTEKGNRVYRGALRQGYIEERAFESRAEARSEKTKIQASVIAFARQKRARGEARREAIGFA